MKLLLHINGQDHTLEYVPGNVSGSSLDGVPFEAEVVEIISGLYSVRIGGRSFSARVAAMPEASGGAAGKRYTVEIDGDNHEVAIHDPRRWQRSRNGIAREGRQQVAAPMPGKVLRVLVAEGQRVEAGQGLVVVEAMKMQNEIKSHSSGTVENVLVAEGQAVTAGETLLIIE